MKIQLQPNKRQMADLKVLCDLGSEEIAKVVDGLAQLDHQPLSIESFLSTLKKFTDRPDDVIQSLGRQALSLNTLIRKSALDVEDATGALTKAIKDGADWSPEELKKWATVEIQLKRLLTSDKISIVSKTLDLTYDFANLYRNGRILTDIRPIFDDHSNDIRGSVISFTFRLQYDSGDGDHGLSIAMDKKDVEQLLHQCTRALEKAKSSHELMSGIKAIPSVIAGEEHDV